MSHMNMNGMNGVNGAVGGMPMINHATNGTSSRNGTDQDRDNDYEIKLNTHIYDYFLKNEKYDCARSLLNSGLKLTTRKTSPGHRDVNGVDDNSMDADLKDNLDSNRPDDLPHPVVLSINQHTSFLLEWFSVFWDMYFAQRKAPQASTQAIQYVQHTQQQSRLRQEQQQRFLQQPGMMNTGMQSYQNMLRMQQHAGGMPMNAQDLRLRATQNSGRQVTPQQISQMQANQVSQQRMLQQQQAMQRDGSDGDMNGQRPRTPSSGENAPSPSKRQRLEGPPFLMGNGQMMPNGRQPQGMQGPQMIGPVQANNANNLLIQAGINPGSLSQTQLESFHTQNPQVQKKSIQVYAQNMAQQHRQNMPQPGMPNQGSPMMPSGLEVGAGMTDLYGNQAHMRMPNIPQNGATGNHALQDYQMQLMLLEQQNKKRLLLAKQEQDAGRPDGQPMAGQPGFPTGMSPQGSRSGPSPNPQDQMKRGSPKMGQGLTGSPMPDGGMLQNRGSPAAMNFNGMSGGMPPEMFQSMKGIGDGMGVLGPNGQVMRPPSSNPQFNVGGFNPQQMEQIRQQQQNGARMQNANWQQGSQGQAPMAPQPAQTQQPPQMGTPIQRNTAMPPPQAPPTANTINGRPTSPAAPAPAPATPQASKAPNPKKAKDKKDRKPPAKKNSVAAATTSSEVENPPPATTPSTPSHPDSFKGGKNGNGQNQSNNMQVTAPAPAPVTTMQPPQDLNGIQAFGNMDPIDPSMDMSFSGMEGADVLDQFDFDSFLQDNADHTIDFDASLAFSNFDTTEAVVGDN